VVDVRGREAQKTESRVEQPILPAIVFRQAVPMVGPVVLDDEPRFGVVKVRSSKDRILVAKLHLDFGTR
jgi:hypothetical protein